MTKPILERYQRHLFHKRRDNGKPLSFRALALSFQTLGDVDGVNPWDPDQLEAWLRSGAPGHGAMCAGRFVLSVWNSYHEWTAGRFDLHEALGCSLRNCRGSGRLPPALSKHGTARAGPSHAGLGASLPRRWANAPIRGTMTNMQALIAHVKNGRLVLDEPTDLAEGSAVPLKVADDWDELDDEERAALHESIREGIEDMEAGRTVDARTAIAELRSRL